MRNHEEIFAEVREAFMDMDLHEEIDVKRVEIALRELDEIEGKYAPDWECAVMNMLMFIGILVGTMSAERINGIGEEDQLHKEMETIFKILSKHYSVN